MGVNGVLPTWLLYEASLAAIIINSAITRHSISAKSSVPLAFLLVFITLNSGYPVRGHALKGSSSRSLVLGTPDTTTTEEPSDSAVHASQSTFHETEMARLLDIDVTRPMKYVSAEILRVGYKGHTLSEPFAKSSLPANRYGDMIVPDTLLQGNSPAWEIWPHSDGKSSEILYQFHESSSPCVQSVVKEAMTHISMAAPCVNFTDVQTSGNPSGGQVLNISADDNGCYASLGYSTVHKNVINIGRGCINVNTAFHLLLHVVGVAHEHQRPDRAEYIEVDESNIDGVIQPNGMEMKMNFQPFDGTGTVWEEQVRTVPYDVASVSHGGACHYSFGRFREGNCPETLIPRKVLGETAGEVIGNRAFLTAHDIALLRIMYGCGDGHYRNGEGHMAAASNIVYDISGKALSETVTVLKSCMLDDQATFDWEPEREAKVKPTDPPTTTTTTTTTTSTTKAPETAAPVEAPTTTLPAETTLVPEDEETVATTEPQEKGTSAVKITIAVLFCVLLGAVVAYVVLDWWAPGEQAKASVKRITHRGGEESDELLEGSGALLPHEE